MTTQTIDQLGRPFPAFSYGVTHKKAFSSASVPIDDVIGDECQLVLVWTSSDAHIAVGKNPTATLGSKPVTAKVDTPVVVQPGDKIAVIADTTDGDLYVTELL